MESAGGHRASREAYARKAFPPPMPHKLENLRGPGFSNIVIRGFLLEKGMRLAEGGAYLYHDPCHSPLKQQDPMKTVSISISLSFWPGFRPM